MVKSTEVRCGKEQVSCEKNRILIKASHSTLWDSWRPSYPLTGPFICSRDHSLAPTEGKIDPLNHKFLKNKGGELPISGMSLCYGSQMRQLQSRLSDFWNCISLSFAGSYCMNPQANFSRFFCLFVFKSGKWQKFSGSLVKFNEMLI